MVISSMMKAYNVFILLSLPRYRVTCTLVLAVMKAKKDFPRER